MPSKKQLICHLLKLGYTKQEIANWFGIKLNTVQRYSYDCQNEEIPNLEEKVALLEKEIRMLKEKLEKLEATRIISTRIPTEAFLTPEALEAIKHRVDRAQEILKTITELICQHLKASDVEPVTADSYSPYQYYGVTLGHLSLQCFYRPSLAKDYALQRVKPRLIYSNTGRPVKITIEKVEKLGEILTDILKRLERKATESESFLEAYKAVYNYLKSKGLITEKEVKEQ